MEDGGGGGGHSGLLDGSDLCGEGVSGERERRAIRGTNQEVNRCLEREALLHAQTAFGKGDDGIQVGGDDDEDARVVADDLEGGRGEGDRRVSAGGEGERRVQLKRSLTELQKTRKACTVSGFSSIAVGEGQKRSANRSRRRGGDDRLSTHSSNPHESPIHSPTPP